MQPHFYYPQAQEQSRTFPNNFLSSQRKLPPKPTTLRGGSTMPMSAGSSDGISDDVKYSSSKSNDDYRAITDSDMLSSHSEIAQLFPQSYSIISELGSGGAGKAYVVTGKSDGKHYVAKEIICLGDKYRPAAASYALHETRLMYLLRHPHIVQLRDFYPKSSSYFIVMEYCEQGDLGNQIDTAIRQRTNFESERIYTWWFQLLDGLDCCHKNGVIHRDLKPKNIFLDRNLHIRIGDFGVSALTSFPPAIERVGTIAYHAPEVHTSLQYTHKSDIWSLGCIMWEAMALKNVGSEIAKFQANRFGSLPEIYGPTAHELMALHLQTEPERRSDAGVLKDSMLQLLTGSIKATLGLRVSTSAAISAASLEKQRAWMRPKTLDLGSQNLKADDGIATVKAPSPRASYERTMPKQSLRSTWEELNPYQPNQVSSQSSTGTSLSSASTVRRELFTLADVGISLSPGEGGEFRAWKITELAPNKPAARSGQVSEGEYLWEVESKVIFGLPFQLIANMVKGRTGQDIKLGIKPGISLPVRQVLLSLDSEISGTSNPTSTLQTQPAPDAIESLLTGAGLTVMKENTSSLDPSRALPFENSSAGTASKLDRQTKADSKQDRTLEENQALAKRELSKKGDNSTSLMFTSSAANTVSPQRVRLSPMWKVNDMDKNVEMDTIPNLGGEDAKGAKASGLSVLKKDWILSEETNRPSAPAALETTGVASISGDGYYTGDLLDGKPFGTGTATWHLQGHTYVGEWRNGVMHGTGTATYLNGDRYDGEWSNGKRSGLGRYAHGSGDVYEGLWANERKHGLGVDTFADGRGYRGEFQDNKFAGLGAYFSVDGAVYEVAQGDWHQGKAHGCGISTSILGGQPAFVKYVHGNLVSSEAMSLPLHFEQQERVTKQSRWATAVAILARRVASSIQMKKIESPLPSGKDIEEIAWREYVPTDEFTSTLSQALAALTGLRTSTHKDSWLVAEDLSDVVTDSSLERINVTDRIQDVRHRSCCWYKGMTQDEIVQYLQDDKGFSERKFR